MKILYGLIFLLSSISFVYGEKKHSTEHSFHHYDHIHKKKSTIKQKKKNLIVPKENGVVAIFADGLVCSFCAYAIEKNIKKLKFIDKSKWKKGIIVNPEKGIIKIALLFQNEKIDFQKILDAIKKGSYFPKKVYFLLKGTLKLDKNKFVLKDEWFQKKFSLNYDKKLNLYNSKKVQIKGMFDVEKKKEIQEPYNLEIIDIIVVKNKKL